MLEVDLGFAADGFICHTQLKARCLEAHRVAQRGNAKNFDALYLAAKDEDAAATWLGDTTEFRILGDEIDLEEYDESGDARKRWRDAMDAAGMDHGEVARSLCSLILLGEIQFTSSLQCEPAGALDAAAKALGVNAGALLGALLAGAETAEKAAEQRDAALEALYHRLVYLVLRLVTEQLQGESKAISQSIKIMELPSVDPGAGGFHGLLLQNLSEACFGRMLHAARSPEAGVLRDGSDEQARAAEDLCEELMKACESQDVGRVKAWAQAKSQVQGLMHISGETVTISGACGDVKHALNKSFVSAASGTTVSQELLQVLGQSSCKFWRSLADVSPGAVSGIDAAQEALDVLDGCFQGEAKAKTWLLCCLRPNDTGQADRVNRQVMLRQVEQMRLADAVHLSSGHCIMWPLKAFRHQYSSLAPTLNDSMSDEDACRLLVKSTGGGEGTVGKDKVYGGEILEQLMEHKLEESQGTKSEMRKLMEEKLEADQMRARQQEEQLEKAQQEIDNMRGQHHDVAKQQQELLQKLQEQQLELQKQQQEQMEALRQQQMMELERLRKQQEDASAAAQAEPAKQPSAAPETSVDDHELDEEQPSVGAESAERPPVEALRPLLPKTWRFCQRGMEGGESTRRSYPAAHAALAQMAALLRVAKEREQCMVEYELFQQETMHDLKSECEGWRKEAQLLHLQVSDLQRGLQDPTWRRAANRSNLATALALPTQVIERAASR